MRRSRVKELVTAAIFLGVVIVLAALIYRVHPPGEEEEGEEEGGVGDVRVTKVEQRAIALHIEATGRIEALPNHEADVASELSGRLTSVRIKPGDTVRAGQVLAEVYAQDLQALASEAAGRAEMAKAAVGRAEAEASREAKELPARVQEAQAAVDAARATLERLEHGPRAEEIEKARAKLAEEQAKLERLEHGSREEEIRAARAMLAQEEAELARLKAGPRKEEVEAAAARLRVEEADLDRLRAGPRAEERAEAEAALASAQVVLETAKREAERRKALFDEGIVSLTDKEAAEAQLARAQGAYDAAKQRRDMLQAGTRVEELRAQEERVRAARAEYEQLARGYRPEELQRQEEKVKAAQANLDLALAGPRTEDIETQRAAVAQARWEVSLLEAGTREEDIAAAKAALRDAEAQLAAAKAGQHSLDAMRRAVAMARGTSKEAAAAAAAARAVAGKAVIRAPIGGKVAAVNVNKGEVVSAGQLIAEILNLDAVRMMLDVPAQQAVALKPGMQATVQVDALPDKTFPAKVAAVLAEVDPQAETVPAILYLENEKRVLREEMFGKAVIDIKDLPPRPALPKEAVVSREGGNWVFVVDKEQIAHQRVVKLGPADEKWVQVREGLKVGEQVVVWGQFALVDGSKVRIRK